MGGFTSHFWEESRVAVEVGDHQRPTFCIFGHIGVDGHSPLEAQAADNGFKDQKPG